MIVLHAIADELIVLVFGGGQKGMNLKSIRVLRLLRIVRVVRVIRVIRFFREFRMMVLSILGSMRSLVWVVVLLMLTIYIFAIILTQAATGFRADEANPAEEREALEEAYGALTVTMMTLYKAVSGGDDWGGLMDPLTVIHEGWSFLFVFYITFTVFAVLNVVTGVFVSSAMEAAAADRDNVIQEEMSRQNSYVNDIKRMFHEADKDRSGTVSASEFESHLNDNRVKAYFNALELDVTEARGLFRLLDLDESGHVDIDEFVVGCMRLKGQAKSIDVATLMYENKRMMSKWTSFMCYCDESFKVIMRAERRVQQKLDGMFGGPTSSKARR